MQGELFLACAFKDKSCRKDVFSGGSCKEDSRRSIFLAKVLYRIYKSCGKDVFGGGAFKDKSCGKDVFSGGACKHKSFGEDLFSGMPARVRHASRMCVSGGVCKEESCRINCLAEELSRRGHAGGIV